MSDINEKELEKQMNDNVEEFDMSEDEMKEAKKGGYNPFWITKDMEYNKPYKFRIVSDKILIREIEDKFEDGKKTKRMVISVELLETGMVYDLSTRKDPNKKTNKYSSLTNAMRRLYAITGGNIKDKMMSLVKTKYKHETYGDTDAFAINLITIDDE